MNEAQYGWCVSKQKDKEESQNPLVGCFIDLG